MIVKELSKDILYIENAFEKAQEFVDKIESFEQDSEMYSVIPKWEDWHDSVPHQGEDGEWHTSYHDHPKGKQKLFNWNRSLTFFNSLWPVPEDNFSDYAHKKASPVIDMIHDPYLKVLDIWYSKTGHEKLEYVSKNYTLKKYNTGGEIGIHIDRNIEDLKSTMDYTALFYLTDSYDGGEIEFPDINLTLKPSAGSALLFPTNLPHRALEVLSGDKYFIFMYIHTEFGHTTSLYEEFSALNAAILEHREIDNHSALN
jgi:hypothetical protein